MKVYIIETPDGEWFETESTAWKQALRRAPRVNGGMVEIDGFKYVVNPLLFRREKYSPRWIKGIGLLVGFGALIAFALNQAIIGSLLLLAALAVIGSTRTFMAEMQIQLWQENNPDPIPFFNNPLPNGITGDMIAKYARAKHIEKFLNPQEMNWYAVIAVISVLGLIGAIIALYVGK